MKNKGFFKTAAALLAALVLLGGFSVTAYAGGGEDIPTNDSGVIVETEPQPLTPDGNLSLIDDIEGEAAEDKQFIIVQSKNGNYFYIIVDRAALRGIGHRQGGRREQKHQRKQPGNPAFHQAFLLLSLIGGGLRAVVKQRGIAYTRPARQQAAEAVHPLIIAGRSLVIGHG